MKNSRTILVTYLVLGAILQAAVLVLVALPQLNPLRSKIEEATGVSQSLFWIPLLLLLLVADALILKRLHSLLVRPMQELVNQTKLRSAKFAFKMKSMNREEDHLKHFIESQCMRFEELEQEIANTEREVERVTTLSQTSPEEVEALQQKLSNSEAQQADTQILVEEERQKASQLEKEMTSLRRELKMQGRELEDLQNESERWAKGNDGDPSLSPIAEALKDRLSLINNLSWRLARSWEDTPPSKIREGLDEICQQSEAQLELLKKRQASNESDAEPS